MNFYRSRPLALMISLCFASTALSILLPAAAKLLFILFCLIAVPIFTLLLCRLGVGQICNIPTAVFFTVASAFMICSVLISYAYCDVYAGKYSEYDSGTVCAEIISVESTTSYSTVYIARLKTHDGKPVRAKGLIYSETAIGLSPGDLIEVSAEFVPFEDFYIAYERSRLRFISDGYVFTCNTVDTPEIIGKIKSIEVWLSNLRETFDAKMSLCLSDNASALVNALFLGNRSGLGKIYRDFTRIGVVHLLALSGLHLAVLDSMVSKVLAAFGVRPKARNILTLLFIIFYTALTGFLMSVLRAALMLTISRIAMFINQRADKITTLFVACGLIVLANPATVFDASLQLSFTSTLGILLVCDKRQKDFDIITYGRMKVLRSAMLGLYDEILVCVTAVVFILPLQWFYFGEVSPISVPATLIMAFLCEGMLILIPIYLAVCLAGLHIFGVGMGWTLEILTKLSADAAAILSSAVSPVSLGYSFTLPIIIACFGVIVFMMAKNYPSWRYSLIPIGISVAIFLSCAAIYESAHMRDAVVEYINAESGDALMAISNRRALVIDISDGTSDIYYDTLNRLAGNSITEIDTLLYTNIRRKHVNSLRKILNRRFIRRILLPTPVSEYDGYIIMEMAALAEEYGSDVIFYANSGGTEITFGEVYVGLREQVVLERSAYPLISLDIGCNKNRITYIGKSVWEDDGLWREVKDAEYMILGGYGAGIKSLPDSEVRAETKVICIGDDTLFSEMSPWFGGFGGTLIREDRLKIDFTSRERLPYSQ